MKITTTKKLRGVLEIPGLNCQLSYNHIKNKAQVITVNDNFLFDTNVRTAESMKLIEITEAPEKVINEEDGFEQETSAVILTNLTSNEILITVNKDKINIPGKCSVKVSSSILSNSHVLEAINSGKLKPDGGVAEITEVTEEQEVSVQETIPVVANPNEEETYETKQSLNKINAPEKPQTAPTKPSSINIYSPNEIDDTEDEKNEVDFIDKNTKHENEIAFVDKEQEKNELKEFQKRVKTGTTKTKKTKKLEGTTPVVVELKENQSKKSIKKRTKKTDTKHEVKENAEEEKEKEVFNIE